MRESQLSHKYVNWLRDRGYLVFKLNDRTTEGIPDCVVIGRQKTTWIEFKRWPIKISEIQKENLKEIERRQPMCAFIVVVLKVGRDDRLFVISPGMEDIKQYTASPLTYEEATRRMML